MKAISPNPHVYGAGPTALEREQASQNQIRWDEGTIVWGADDALPLRIMTAVNQSPTTTSCLGTTETFIKGSGFTDEELMKMPVDASGATLWELHTSLCQYFALLESFAVNFKFDRAGRITQTLNVGPETLRFMKPAEGTKKICHLKHNPYFGTLEYQEHFGVQYPVYDLATILDQIKEPGFRGQVYFYGTLRPPFKFYPVPKYWSGENWIYVDGNIQAFHKSNLDNGFFQSSLMNVIGDPQQKSKNPRYMKEVLQSDGVTKRLVNDGTTIGQELNDQMSASFSGARKAGTAMVLWSLTKDQAVTLQPFPVNSQFDVMSGTFTDAMRGITAATRVPAILANLPQQGSSLGSDGNAIKAAIDFMHTNVAGQQQILENFYNTVMLPNLQAKTSARVKIKNFIPINTQVVVEDKFWEVLSPEEKKTFVKNNVQGMSEVIIDTVQPVDETGTPITPEEKALNDNLKNLTGRQQIQLNRIARQFSKGDITFDQAKLQLQSGFAFDDADVNMWLGINETAP